MKNLVYVGTSDVREFSTSDLEVLGIDRKEALSFQRAIPLEVSDAAAKKLLEDPRLAGEFAEEGTDAAEAAEPSDPDTSAMLAPAGDQVGPGAGGADSPATTGATSTTGGAGGGAGGGSTTGGSGAGGGGAASSRTSGRGGRGSTSGAG